MSHPAFLIACSLALCCASPGLHRIDPQTPQGLQRLLTPTGGALPFVSAHRGGPRKGFPENCLATFEETLRHTHATMEIDPRYTKDGAIVLHHDPTLNKYRLFNHTGHRVTSPVCTT